MPLKDAWIITAQNWKNYLCEDLECCLPQPLETITDSKAKAVLVYQGGSISGYFTAPDPFDRFMLRAVLKLKRPTGAE